MYNFHEKKCYVALIVKGMQIKIRMVNYFLSTRLVVDEIVDFKILKIYNIKCW